MDVRTELVSMAIQMSTMANDLQHRRMNREGTIGALFGMHSKLMDINAYLYEGEGGEMNAGAGESVCHEHSMINTHPSVIDVGIRTHSADADNLSTRLCRAFRQSDDYIRHWSNGRWHERGCICTDCIGSS
jgi:hypothetical protein